MAGLFDPVHSLSFPADHTPGSGGSSVRTPLRSRVRRPLPFLGAALVVACSGDDLTGPALVDDAGGRDIAVAAVNGRIAFDSDRDGNDEIYVMNADGTGQTRLTNNVVSDLQSAWSPDGTKIAFQSTRDGNPEIYAMNADGTAPTRLTTRSCAARQAW